VLPEAQIGSHEGTSAVPRNHSSPHSLDPGQAARPLVRSGRRCHRMDRAPQRRACRL